MPLTFRKVAAVMLTITSMGIQPVVGQGFVDWCAYQGANLTDHWLGMYCRNNDIREFSYNWTWIDLNSCVGNNDGRLLAWPNSNFSTSCGDCSVSHGKTLALTCTCVNTRAQRFVSTVDLNQTIYDSNGCLGCWGLSGIKCFTPDQC